LLEHVDVGVRKITGAMIGLLLSPRRLFRERRALVDVTALPVNTPRRRQQSPVDRWGPKLSGDQFTNCWTTKP
jgi:hypothetical protein